MFPARGVSVGGSAVGSACSRMAAGADMRWLLLGLALVASTGAAASHPARPGTPRVRAEVRVPAPATGLVDVRIELPAELMAGRDHLDIGFLAAKQLGAAVRRIEAQAGGRRLAVIEPDPARPHIKRVLRPPGTGRTVLRYTIDPTYFPPGQVLAHTGNAQARVTKWLGVLRTSAVFPLFAEADRLPADVTFELPPGWSAVTPWTAMGGRYRLTAEEFAATDYVGIGPFLVSHVAVGEARIRVGALGGSAPERLTALVTLVRAALEVVRLPLPQSGVLAALVVPQEFMSGGAAGERTIVQPFWPDVLVHEVFHWWNDMDLTRDEAAWFREGLSEYYGIRIANAAGAITDEAARACLADLEAEARLLDGDDPISLGRASLVMEDTRARRVVYAKGALFGLVLDRHLAVHGRTLDEGMRAVFASGRSGLGNAEIASIFHRVYGGSADWLLRKFVDNGAPLPDLALPEAQGKSGCARFFPSR